MVFRVLPVLALLPLVLAARTVPPAGGTLVLRNTRWDAVRVEARMGRATDCSANPLLGTRTLRRRQQWTFVSSQAVCWRREVTPGEPGRGWTTWTHARVPANTKQEVDL